MTVTTLDAKAALIVIDLQQGIVALAGGEALNAVVSRVAALAEAFRARGLPVILVNVAGMAPGRTERGRVAPAAFPAGWTDLIAELNRQPSDHVVTKHTPGAFTGTDLETHLRSRGVTQVVLAGVATSSGVEATARQAYELGYNVAFAVDAMTDTRPEDHDWCIARVFPRIGETGTTLAIIDLLERSA